MRTSGPIRGKRLGSVPVPRETRFLCGLLTQELSGWSGVSMRLRFGLRAFYRGTVIFAVLPDQRSVGVARAIAYKEDGRWKLLELTGERDLAQALVNLDKAYTKATAVKPRPGAPD